jgi:hypothetical protein
MPEPTGGVVVKAPAVRLPDVQNVERQVIRNANLAVRVESVEKAEKEATAIVRSIHGYTSNATSSDLASAKPTLVLTLRVPVGQFDDCIAKFEALGTRVSKTISSEDVTSQIVDIDARLKVLVAQEVVYRNMLRDHMKITDVFTIQNHLDEVRTQIESLTAQRKTQAGLAALSTIELTLEQTAVAGGDTKDKGWVSQSWADSYNSSAASLRAVAGVGVWLVCFSPFWVPVLLLGLLLWKLHKAKASKFPVMRS